MVPTPHMYTPVMCVCICPQRHFPTLKLAVQWLKEECGCAVVGVEICEGAHALSSAPFSGPTAFLLGNEGQGLSQEEMDVCDWFVSPFSLFSLLIASSL